MAVVNINGSSLTNTYATPVVLSNSYLADAGDWTTTDVCAAGASDLATSTYRFMRIPSNALVLNIAAMNDANTSGTSYKCGVLLPNAGGVVVAASDQIFFSAVTMASARSVWTNLLFPSILGAGGLVANTKLRVWELLGLAADPSATYEIAITAVTAGSAGGNMALQVNWTR